MSVPDKGKEKSPNTVANTPSPTPVSVKKGAAKGKAPSAMEILSAPPRKK